MHIPFQMHLIFLLSGLLIALVLTVITGVMRVILDISFNTSPFVIGIILYAIGFVAFYLTGHIPL